MATHEKSYETAIPEEYLAVRCLLRFLGRDPDDEHVKDTPRRVLALYRELLDQGQVEINGTTFASEADDLVVVKDIPLHSLCEHHMLPYSGVAHIGYIPNGRVLGLSKFARTVAKVASGLTVQETVTRNIALAISDMAPSEDVAVITEASHSCMILRGAKAFGTSTSASSMLGVFRTDVALRAEFLNLIRA